MSKYDLLPCTHQEHSGRYDRSGDCHYAHARLGIEERMVRGLIRGLKKTGYTPVCTYDGGEYVEGNTETATLDTVFSVDESTISFKGKDGEIWGVLIVLGNGGDCIVDYNVSRDEHSEWNVAIERITDELYERHGDC